MTTFAWTDDKVQEMKKLWEAGLSAAQIASEIGAPTRNTVCGKLNRLRIFKPKKPRQPRQRREPKFRPRVHAVVGAPTIVEAPVKASVPDHAIPIEQRRTLLQLGTAECHWPVGDPGAADFFFCGGKVWADGPYCAHHSRRAHAAYSFGRSQQPPVST